ncbi:glycine betaine ABC transporter substrate-binding protein [Arthrobacter sp. NIO-1057]|uniref:glycine betaine ABC transporter substrate-binding protein n=1 Tax=Arthrobacter sp. NIO-1057 TaxID=993071 RepID=UPI00159EFDEE|nr:glycine betaine ABC transporter substrate-binding protein [Arthrobacter sp. NIO-1057]
MRKTSRLAVLSVALLLPLTACTDQDQSTDGSSDQNVVLKLARGDQPVEQALGEVYRNALKAKGFEVQINKSMDDPYQQVLDGEADIAVDYAGEALSMAKDASSITGEDGVLSVDELKNLRSEINDSNDSIEALDLSNADSGKVLVMSSAEAETHSVDSLSSLASACEKLTIITDDSETANLESGLKIAGCQKPQLSVVQSDDLATQLRASVDRAVAMSAGNAMISDEGFKSISDTAKLFDSQPIMLLASNNVNNKARGELNKITGQLSQQTLVELNRMVNAPGAMKPAQAANRWEWIIE